MKTYVRTTSESVYAIERRGDQWFFTALFASGKGSRFMDTEYEVYEPQEPIVGQRWDVYGKTPDFPSSAGFLSTSRVSEVSEVAPCVG